VAREEPTLASVRARLDELTDGCPLPAAAAPSTAGSQNWGEGGALANPRPGRLPRVAYLLPGLPPEGSGGSHSLVQEARGMRALGAHAWICVPEDSLETAATLYGNEDELFLSYPDEGSALPGVSGASVADAIATADVAIATEYPSVDLLARIARARPGLTCAYYVQDYEPLFAAPESSRADRALLSYRAIPGQLLFAKTQWLAGLVSAAHGVPVAKVCPSLDRELFHARGRDGGVEPDPEPEGLGGQRSPPAGRVPRVAAMIRPRTPRRRPVATLAALALVAQALGEQVEIVTFGCDAEAFARLDAPAVAGIQHLALLSRAAVADLMRGCEVFLDGSAYQAFGRTGLEAMACGTVPVLPGLGGVHEYAVHERNALILENGDPAEMAAAVIELVREPDRLHLMREAGLRTVRRFSIELAARSQLELFTAAAA
jgi:hypothetical protein